jgi:hypothetical protein
VSPYLMTRLVTAAKGGALFPRGDMLGDDFTTMKVAMSFGSQHVFHSLRHGAAGRIRAARPAVPSTLQIRFSAGPMPGCWRAMPRITRRRSK